jgi:Na+-transporting NADH:ubiquinone oxidoreductase subunit NqrB
MRRPDPRYYQIATLGALVLYGLFALELEIDITIATTVLTLALMTQWACTRIVALPRFDPKSALISGLSLCLLLRTNYLALAALAAVVTIGSKFAIRVDGRHLMNPTNFGLVALMSTTGLVWVSPGQWGSQAFFLLLMASLGGLVIHRADRSDVTYAFIAFYGAIVAGRALYLGDPMELPLHHLKNGAFLLFAFFMLSDPKTTPDSRPARILFALIVALGAAFVHFVLFEPNGFLWSLAVCSITTPVLNRLFPGRRYAWLPQPVEPSHDLPERSFA